MLILQDRLALLASIPLRSGSHGSVEEGMCAMEAVAFVAGEAHTDTPACACPVIAAFMRSWNDGLPDDARRDLYLKRFIPRLVGSRDSLAVAERRSYLALDWLIRVYTPAWLDLVEATKPHASALRALGEIVNMASAEAAGPVVRAAGAAARAAARAAAGDASGDAAWDAAWAAAWDAARDAARAAAWDALRPTVETLQVSALDLLERMIAAGSP